MVQQIFKCLFVFFKKQLWLSLWVKLLTWIKMSLRSPLDTCDFLHKGFLAKKLFLTIHFKQKHWSLFPKKPPAEACISYKCTEVLSIDCFAFCHHFHLGIAYYSLLWGCLSENHFKTHVWGKDIFKGNYIHISRFAQIRLTYSESQTDLNCKASFLCTRVVIFPEDC